MGSAVDAIAGYLQDPVFELFIAIRQRAELPQGHEVLFDIFDAGLYPPLLFGVPGRAGRDDKAVSLGTRCIGALNGRIVVTGPCDGALGVINDEFLGNACKELEGPAVAGQPGIHALIGNDLSVLMPAETKGHDKEPCLDHFPGKNVDDLRAGTEVHLGGLAWSKIQDGGDLGVSFFELGKKAPDAGIAPLKRVFTHKGLVNGGSLNAFFHPCSHFIGVGFDQ